MLPDFHLDHLFQEVAANVGYRLAIDLPAQTVSTPSGQVMRFDVEPFRKECLVNGWDDIGLTLRRQDAIRAYEERRRAAEPWIFS